MWNTQTYIVYMSAQQAQSGHLCIGAALNKILSYDIIRQVKKIASSFDNDTTGCYNNIVPPQAMINSHRIGLPRSAVVMLTTILNNTVYILCIGHSLLARTYQINTLRRILSTGQGSCASPSIWILVLWTPHCGPSQ